MKLEVTNLSKAYPLQGGRGRHKPHKRVLDQISFTVQEGELLVVMGPSGCGKTTLLRCIAGLEDLQRGRIFAGGQDVTELSPGQRNFAMVFQDPALYPYLTVEENITFGMKARREDRATMHAKLTRAAGMLGIDSILARRPAELSGGERHRVALARALVREPAAFLVDEPLSNLDAQLRVSIRSEFRSLQTEIKATTVYVTHDASEAMALADVVAVLHDGHIEQIGTPADVYAHPATVFVARSFGNPGMNIFPGELLAGGTAHLGLRPEAVRISSEGKARLVGLLKTVERLGPESLAEVLLGEQRLWVRVPGSVPDLTVGSHVGLCFSDHDVYRFDQSGAAVVPE